MRERCGDELEPASSRLLEEAAFAAGTVPTTPASGSTGGTRGRRSEDTGGA